jgi:quercetin dioxygenase-like cupin family protein
MPLEAMAQFIGGSVRIADLLGKRKDADASRRESADVGCRPADNAAGFAGSDETEPHEREVDRRDPTQEGVPFVSRIRSTPSTQLPPHWHAIDENITVLSGVFCVGVGDTLDEHACRNVPEGSYIVMPKGMHHFAIAKGDVVQVHGIGPFTIHWVK